MRLAILCPLLVLSVSAPLQARQAVAPGPLARVERSWLTLRTLQDQARITRDLGATVSPRGVPLDSLNARVAAARAALRAQAAEVQVGRLTPADARAFTLLTDHLAALEARSDSGQRSGLDSLTRRTFAAYGDAARRIIVDGDTLDRLSILGLLGRTDDRDRRRRLFLALEPVWRSVNGDDRDASAYRRLVRLRLASWPADSSPMAERARGLGVAPDTLERWLVEVLEAWRDTQPDSLIEPWDFHYGNGEASRLLSARIPRDSLRPITERYYRTLGADPVRLRVHYDLDPKPGKYPVSFTDFGARDPVEPWVFTSYRIGGFDNLGELLHEVGHAVHIAAIDTRPAYTDWPDSDTFTEAIADLAALEVDEPAWQRKFLGAGAPVAASLRSKYGGIVLDVAWALFEIRVHRAPDRSPNEIWSELTRDYLRIRPHPEWSWWAMRGQLVDGPGYMLNYAFGAILIADIRAEVARRHGSFTTGDATWYRWVAPRLYKFGLERPALDVVKGFLGRPVSPGAILRDMHRMASR